jgi:hypothetical protein
VGGRVVAVAVINKEVEGERNCKEDSLIKERS